MPDVESKLQRLLLAAVLASLAAAVEAQPPPDGAALMREGNSLYRSGLYRAALLRYREAADAGIDSPLLDYNLGVVYYRLERYADAERSLALAAEDSRLAPLATYNRGLAQLALGDAAAAEASFMSVAKSPAKRDLRRLAERAAARARGAGSTGEPGPDRRTAGGAQRPAERPRDFQLLAFARMAQDGNVYRAPSAPYVDLAAQGQPTVTPVVRSASFVPVDLIARYLLPNEAGDTDFIFAYRLDGDFYSGEFSNATTVSQRMSVGAHILLDERTNRRRTLDSAFFVRSHEETNYNPDDGLDRVINGEDISGQFRYRSAGAEVGFDHEIGRWRWGLDLTFERRQYEDVSLVTNYDHALYYGGVRMAREINGSTEISFGMQKYRRIYDERRSRDLTGALLSTNPALEYDYTGYEVGVKRRLGRSFELRLDYLLLDRADGFLGYYDYAQRYVRLGAAYRPNSRLAVSLSAGSRVYDYPNAFAYNVPAGGPRELDSTGVDLEIEYVFNRRISLWASIETLGVASTDARAQYDRSVSMLGVKWRRR